MRRIVTLALTGAVTAIIACASAGAPPGGPERHEPPQIIAISPESGATNVKIKEAEIRFDEVVNDRPAASGASQLNQLFLISPRDGDAQVGWHRNRITIRPRKGFRANTAYRVTMLPGLADLRGNVRREGLSILFSTGPTFPSMSIIGIVFDWAAQRPANGAYIEATSLADTTLVYVAATDTLGQFDVGPLNPGTYRVRALIDVNSNRMLDRGEKWDTTTIPVQGVRHAIELDAIERDTVAATISRVTVDDSVTLHVDFTMPLDPALPLQPALFRIQRADSTSLNIVSAQWAAAYDRSRAAADSAARADSIARARPPGDTTRARPVPPPPVAPTPGVRQAPPPPKPHVPPPERIVVLKLSPTTPLVLKSSYVIAAPGVRNLLGKSSPKPFIFTVRPPPPPAPPDTTHRAPRDTTRRPPPTGRPPVSR